MPQTRNNGSLVAYRLGLPAWAYPGWKNRYFPADQPPLASYASVFTIVEGNTSFYAIPDDATVRLWADSLNGTHCHLSFKLPRSVTHQQQPNRHDLERFLTVLEPLTMHLGPFLLQFPAWVDINHLNRLHDVYQALMASTGACIEVRHPRLFAEPDLLEPILQDYGFGRVIMDSRALHRGDQQHLDVRTALHEKPDLPVYTRVYNEQIFVRLVLHPDIVSNEPYIDHWAVQTWQWIKQGLVPRILIHCPNNLHCPELALWFHNRLREYSNDQVPCLTPWPVPQQAQLW